MPSWPTASSRPTNGLMYVAPHLAANPKRADELQSLLKSEGELMPTRVWPNLKALTCWKGGTMPLYHKQLKRWFANLPIQ